MSRFNIGYSVITLMWMAVVVVQTFFCLSAADWAAWVGAIGTVGTLIGTILIATHQSRREQNKGEMDASLTAASLSMRAKYLHGALELVQETMEQMADEDKIVENIAATPGIFELRLWDPVELRPLLSLNNACAIKLVQASEGWFYLCDLMSRSSTNPDLRDPAHFDEFRNQIIMLAQHLQGVAQRAVELCDEAAKRHMHD